MYVCKVFCPEAHLSLDMHYQGSTYISLLDKRNIQLTNLVGIFERKILRKIYGPTQENGEWRLKYNKELYDLHKAPDIITDIKISRLKWAGHIQRMNDSEMVKRISDGWMES